MTTGKVDGRYYIEALGRGLQILEAFSEQSPSLSLTEIASTVGLDKSTVFRSVYTLESLGYLERDPETKRYRPGLKVLRLGFAVLNNLEMAQIAQPYLKALSGKCGETNEHDRPRWQGNRLRGAEQDSAGHQC